MGFLANPFFTNIILPFLLIFTVIYAILEKTALLGEGKKYANVIVAFVVGFLFIGVQAAVGFTVRLIPLVTMLIMVVLCFYLLFGFLGDMHKVRGIQIAMGIIFGLAFIIMVLWASGLMQKFMVGGDASKANAIGIGAIIAVLGAAVSLVIKGQPAHTSS